jgi:hypothetical protein
MAISKHITPATGARVVAETARAIPKPKLPGGIVAGPATGPVTRPTIPRPKITLPATPQPKPKITLPARPAPQPPVRPAPAPPVQVKPLPSPPRPQPGPVPAAPSDNPFRTLPSPTAGSRIKSEDFRQLSQCLQIIFDAHALSNTLLGQSFGEAKQLLAGQHYTIQRVMSVFGAEITHLDDPALDERQVLQVVPAELGEQSVAVIVTEAVETRRLTPNIVGLTYSEASERLRAVLGDVSFSSAPMAAPQLVGLPLSEARRIIS